MYKVKQSVIKDASMILVRGSSASFLSSPGDHGVAVENVSVCEARSPVRATVSSGIKSSLVELFNSTQTLVNVAYSRDKPTDHE